MKWSFSSARAFRNCQRGWFFKNTVANAKAKDPERREAYLLSKLQSISSWRGKLVDRVISDDLVQAIRRNRPITKNELVAIARSTFDAELAFALAHRIREPGQRLSDEQGIAAFHAVEYGKGVSQEEIAQAWIDIETAIENLFSMHNARAALKGATPLISQRTLQFSFAGVTVIAVPDVIAFNRDAPPTIIDWKVHAEGNRDYRLQLALYAMALARCSPHVDFPANLHDFDATTFRLIEAQLLTGIEHEYHVDQADLDELEDFIAASAAEMLAAKAGLKSGELHQEDFAVTQWPEQCQRCSFRKLCWESTHAPT